MSSAASCLPQAWYGKACAFQQLEDRLTGGKEEVWAETGTPQVRLRSADTIPSLITSCGMQMYDRILSDPLQ